MKIIIALPALASMILGSAFGQSGNCQYYAIPFFIDNQMKLTEAMHLSLSCPPVPINIAPSEVIEKGHKEPVVVLASKLFYFAQTNDIDEFVSVATLAAGQARDSDYATECAGYFESIRMKAEKLIGASIVSKCRIQSTELVVFSLPSVGKNANSIGLTMRIDNVENNVFKFYPNLGDTVLSLLESTLTTDIDHGLVSCRNQVTDKYVVPIKISSLHSEDCPARLHFTAETLPAPTGNTLVKVCKELAEALLSLTYPLDKNSSEWSTLSRLTEAQSLALVAKRLEKSPSLEDFKSAIDRYGKQIRTDGWERIIHADPFKVLLTSSNGGKFQSFLIEDGVWKYYGFGNNLGISSWFGGENGSDIISAILETEID